MSINPDNVTTIRVDQLAESTLNLTNEFPHSDGATLKKATIQSLVDLVATAVGSGSGVGFLPISVTDGQQLPNVPADPSFFLCGVGTFLNINGYPNIVCTEELNAIMSVSDHWEIAVEIPINVDLQTIGISQSVNNGVLDKAPSENAVYNFISQWLPKSSLGYFDYADLATQTTPITVAPDTETLLTNDTLGDDTNTSQPPYGVTAIWDADSDEFNFQQLSVGDTVDLRIHLKTTTTTANQKYHIDMKFAFDGPDEFENRIFSQYVKNASEDEQSFVTTLYIGSESVRTYPARLYITSDDDATVEVVGWFCRVFRKSVNIVSVDEAPIDGLTYGRKDAEWVEVTGGGGGIPDAPNNANAYVRSALSWVVGYTKTAIDTLLGNKVDANAPITGTVKTKITYDSKGLITAGADALTSDIADSLNRRYVTDAQLVVIGNTSGINTGDNATNTQYSGLATSKEDTANKSTSTSDSASSVKFPVWSAVVSYVTGLGYLLASTASSTYQVILTSTNFGTFSNSLTDKTTPVDSDTVNLVDSADSNKAKKLSFANLKAWILSFVPTVITSETGIYYFNDFLGVFTTSTNDGNISSDGNVVQTTTAPNSDFNKQGFANVNTTTATSGYGNIYIGHTTTANFILGGGITSYETLIWLPNLSTSGERFSCLIGFSSGVLNQNNSANNIAFLYDEGNIAFAGAGGASANWRAVTTDTGTRTFSDTGIAVNAGAFIKLKIIVNANASSVGFYIDNTLVATHTTNIPSGNTKRLSVRNYIQKSVGSTQRFLILDYVKLQQTFTTAR